jgi:hypothetical protein
MEKCQRHRPGPGLHSDAPIVGRQPCRPRLQANSGGGAARSHGQRRRGVAWITHLTDPVGAWRTRAVIPRQGSGIVSIAQGCTPGRGSAALIAMSGTSVPALVA